MESRVSDYNNWHEVVHGQEQLDEIHLKDWHENALAFAPVLKGKKVLEVGCGVGDFSIYLSKQGASVTAIDFSTTAIDLAKKKARFQECDIDFQVADAQSLPFTENEFELVFSCECLEHIPNPKLALKEMHRVLKPSAYLILTTENYSNAMILYWLKCWLFNEPFNSGEKVQPIDHFFLYWNVKRMFSDVHLTVKKMAGSHHVLLLLPRFHPSSFVIERFSNSLLAYILKPLARHMTFLAVKE